MQGEILRFSEETRTGLIRGDDGAIFSLHLFRLRGRPALSTPG
jgi:hypothetical protein